MFGTALWLAFRRRADRPGWLQLFVLSLLAVAVVLGVSPWYRMTHPWPASLPGYSLTFGVLRSGPAPALPTGTATSRDRMVAFTAGGYGTGPRGGMYAGLALLTVQFGLVGTDRRRRPLPSSADGPPTEPGQ
jgi:hypothetical protein